MNLPDYEDTAAPIDSTPRPRAPQDIAAQKRARAALDQDAAPIARSVTPRQQLLAAGMALLILAFVGAASWQLAQPPARPLAITPVVTAPARMFQTSHQASPAPTSAPTATRVPDYTPPPVVAPAEAVLAAPQTGRGLGIVEQAPAPPAPPAAAPDKGTKAAPDRAARHAAAVARDRQSKGSK